MCVEIPAEGVEAPDFCSFGGGLGEGERGGGCGGAVEGEELGDGFRGVPGFGHEGVACAFVGHAAGHGDDVEGGVGESWAEPGLGGEVGEGGLGEIGRGVSWNFILLVGWGHGW